MFLKKRNKFGNKGRGPSLLESLNLTYYIKRDYVHNPTLIGLQRSFTPDDLKSSHYEVYKDYLEVPVLDDVLELLLINRGIWDKKKNPFDTPSSLSLGWVGSDVPIVPKLTQTMEVGDERKSVVMSVAQIMSSNEPELIETYESKMKALRDLRVSKELINRTTKSAIINRYILNKSEVGNRLTKITRLVGDKGGLYNTIRSYGGYDEISKTARADTIIPRTFRINMDNPEENNREYIESRLGVNPEQIWVFRPVYGSRGIGMKIEKASKILDNFEEWVKPEHTEGRDFREWLFSVFIESFKWKLNTDNPDSVRLASDKLHERHRVIEFRKSSHNMCDIKEMVIDNVKVKTVNVVNPSYRLGKDGKETKGSLLQKPFRDHTFNDTLGRINKGRIWIALDASGGKYSVHVYKKLFFEVCSKEFDPNNPKHYSDIQRTWTDVSPYNYTDVCKPKGMILHNDFHLDEVNGARASDLDLCFIVDWEKGEWKSDHKATTTNTVENWDKIKKNFGIIFKILMDATRASVHCLSETNSEVNSRGCFQYFGVDFIIDSEANVWLLEFNTRPWTGYGFWWNTFDPDQIHMPNKYIFTESLIRRFIDPKFSIEPKRKPLSDVSNIDNLWECVQEWKYNKITSPLAILPSVAPSKNGNNWVKNRALINAYTERGWSIFPYDTLVKSPDLIDKGITPYIRGLLTNYDPNTFYDKMANMYPGMKRSKIVNKIFPLVALLGSKTSMVEVLREVFPKVNNVSGLCDGDCYPWDSIIPFTTTLRKNDPNLRNVLKSLPPNTKFIAKPSMGKQGKGIYISSNLDDIYKHIINSKPEDNKDSNDWIISKYIDNPMLEEDRKFHIRTFVLVSRKNGHIYVYKMEPSLLFMAALPYDSKLCSDFVRTKFKDSVINKLANRDPFYTSLVGDLRSLSNLSQGDYMFKNLMDPKKFGEVIPNARKLSDKITQFQIKDGYEILSKKVPPKLEKQIGPQITQIIKQVIYSVSSRLGCTNDSDNCFQYVALDLMVEERPQGPKVWLLEVNPSPGLKSPTKLLKNKGGLNNFIQSIYDITLEDGKTLAKNQLFKKVLTLKINAKEKSEDLVRSDNMWPYGGSTQTKQNMLLNSLDSFFLDPYFSVDNPFLMDPSLLNAFIQDPYDISLRSQLRLVMDDSRRPPTLKMPNCNTYSTRNQEQCYEDMMATAYLMNAQATSGLTCPGGYPYCFLGSNDLIGMYQPTLGSMSGITWSNFMRQHGMVKLSTQINDYIANNEFKKDTYCFDMDLQKVTDLLGRLQIPIDSRLANSHEKLCVLLKVYLYTGLLEAEMPFASGRGNTRESMEIARFLNNVAMSAPFPLFEQGYFVGLLNDQKFLQVEKFMKQFLASGGQVAPAQPPAALQTGQPVSPFGRRRRRRI